MPSTTDNQSAVPQQQQADISNTINTYRTYVDITERVLKKSRNALDSKELIQMAYGEEKIVDCGGSEMLENILNVKLDDMALKDVLEEFTEHCSNHRHNNKENGDNSNNNSMTVKERMDQIDEAIRFVTEWEARRDQVEAGDISSAQQSLNTTLLPKGVTTQDVVNYREHLQRLEARGALQKELEKVEQEVAAMQKEQAQKKQAVQEKLSRVQKVEQNVEAAANTCAMVS